MPVNIIRLSEQAKLIKGQTHWIGWINHYKVITPWVASEDLSLKPEKELLDYLTSQYEKIRNRQN